MSDRMEVLTYVDLDLVTLYNGGVVAGARSEMRPYLDEALGEFLSPSRMKDIKAGTMMRIKLSLELEEKD